MYRVLKNEVHFWKWGFILPVLFGGLCPIYFVQEEKRFLDMYLTIFFCFKWQFFVAKVEYYMARLLFCVSATNAIAVAVFCGAHVWWPQARYLCPATEMTVADGIFRRREEVVSTVESKLFFFQIIFLRITYSRDEARFSKRTSIFRIFFATMPPPPFSYYFSSLDGNVVSTVSIKQACFYFATSSGRCCCARFRFDCCCVGKDYSVVHTWLHTV